MPEDPGRTVRRLLLATLLVLACTVRIVPALMTAGPTTRIASSTSPYSNPFPGDIAYFYQFAYQHSRGRDPDTANATPLWLEYSYVAFEASRSYGIPFDLFFKGIDILADLGTTALVFLALLSAGRTARTAFGLTAVFALNPVSIIVTSLHGPNDPVIIFLIVLAWWGARRNRFWLSYVALGMGVAIKIYPILLVPIFLLRDPSPWSRKGVAALVVPLPFLVSLIPYAGEDGLALGRVWAYSGVTDFGYLSVLRTWMILHPTAVQSAQELSQAALTIGKVFFLLIYGVILARNRQFSLTRSCLGVFLLFLSVYGGVSAQYHIWVIGLALLPESGFRWRATAIYSVVAAVALWVFYSIFHPGILVGVARTAATASSDLLWLHLGLNAVLWLVIVVWTVRALQPRGIGPTSGAGEGIFASVPGQGRLLSEREKPD